MDDRRLGGIASRQGGLVSAAQLRACGLSHSGIRHRVAAGRLFHVRRGVYALGPVTGQWSSLWAAVLAVDVTRAVVGHWSAALAHGFTDRVIGPHHVVVPSVGRRSVAGVAMHHARSLRPSDVVRVGGLRVTSPARTVLDIAGTAADPVVRRLIREAEFQGALGTGELAAAVEGRRGHPGVARVRRVDPGTVSAALRQTPLEDELAALIARTPLPGPERQARVRGALGARYRVDFAWRAFRLVAEADGRAAHVRESAFQEDRRRDADLGAAGWLTMRVTHEQLSTTPRDVEAQLVAAARHRGWTG